MKKYLFIPVMIAISLTLNAQKTAVLLNQKDAWDLSYTYTGEVLNGKPNGMGVAKYSSGNVIRYVGHFENGFYSGKGVMLFSNGAFLSGNWSKGKVNGKGANLTDNGGFYVGDFANGIKNGQGVFIYKDNSFVKGGYLNDKLNGRCINIWTAGTIISDIYYSNDQRNGTGYQYEVASNKLYEGEWKDDKWVQATSAGFYSFLNQSSFKGEKTDNHILIGAVTASGYLKDTAYYYDLQKQKRYFGAYVNGFIKNGVQVRDDSTRFVGAVDEKGAKGYCYDFKFNKYYTEGNYINDMVDGEIIDIDLAKKTVYMGIATAGDFTGKSYFFNDKNAMYYGDYIKGRLNGKGFRLESSGHLTVGTWEDGIPTTVTSITTAKGETINGTPKSFQESLNIVVRDYAEYYENIIGGITYDDLSYDDWLPVPEDEDVYYDYYNTLTRFFGSTRPDVIADDLDITNLYITTLLQDADEAKAKAKYNEVVKQLTSATLSNPKLAKATKLKGNVSAPDMSKSINSTKFELDTDEATYAPFHIWVKLRKEKDGKYAVSLELGEQEDY